ncbi:transposase, partial [Escherichia coli]
CGGKQLSFATINRFRSNHMIKCIDFYFDAVVSILVEKGVISLEEQYVDGTKIESKANKYTFVWKKTVEKNRAKLLEKTSAALAQIKEQIRLNGGSDIKEEDSEPATSAKDVERSARLCERQAKNLPKAKLTG